MGKLELGKMTKEQKVELIKKITNGNVVIIGSQIIDKSSDGHMQVIEKDGRFYANGDPSAEITKKFIDNYQGGILHLMDNGRGDL